MNDTTDIFCFTLKLAALTKGAIACSKQGEGRKCGGFLVHTSRIHGQIFVIGNFFY